jgi:hypothetical protein
MCSFLAVLLAMAAPSSAPAADGPVALVACAPGYPGTTAEAQPAMDAFAAALARAASWPAGRVTAAYHETEQGGMGRLASPDAALALVPLPFLLQRGEALKLVPRLQVQSTGSELTEVWSLVARRGRIGSPAALDGFTVVSLAGYSPGFVRSALGPWGRIPESARIVHSGQVLSALRKAAGGEKVALLLDGAQAAALGTLPFAGDLEVVARSAPLPAAFVCTVGNRLAAARWKALEKALLALPSTPEGASAMEGLRFVRFAPVDAAALTAARRAFAGRPR